MSKEVVWTKIILETFLEESGILDRIELGDEKARILEGIMRTRCIKNKQQWKWLTYTLD